MDYSFQTPYGKMVLESLVTKSQYSEHDTASFAGVLTLAGSKYMVGMTLVRDHGSVLWRFLDHRHHDAYPCLLSISCKPAQDASVVAPYEPTEDDGYVNFQQLAKTAMVALFEELRVLLTTPNAFDWLASEEALHKASEANRRELSTFGN